MTANIEVMPKIGTFTTGLRDGSNYLLSINNHVVSTAYHVKPTIKASIDFAIANRRPAKCEVCPSLLGELLTMVAADLVTIKLRNTIISYDTLDCVEGSVNAYGLDATEFSSVCLATSTPFFVKLEITSCCNLKCRYCYMSGAPTKYRSQDDWCLALHKLRSLGIVRLEITGGEPFLYKHLVEVLSQADKLGFDCTVATNGMFLDSNKVEALAELRNVDFRISFHSSDQLEFDAFVGAVGAQEKVIEALRLLREARIRHTAMVVVTSHNEASVLDTVGFLERLGVPYFLSSHVFPQLYRNNTNAKYRASCGSIQRLTGLGLLPRQRATKCTALRTKFWVSCAGDVYPCEFLRKEAVGNVFHDEVSDLFNLNDCCGSEKRFIPRTGDCASCSERDNCNRCPALCVFQSHGGSFFSAHP